MFVEGDTVDAEGEPDEVDVLAGVADRVGSTEPHGVVEVAVDGLSVVAAGVEPGEVGIIGGNGAYVLGAVQAAFVVVGVAVEADGDCAVSGPAGSR